VVEMQRSLQAHEWPSGEQVRVRMGVHSGEAAETATGLVGLDVHRAARIAAVAHGGQALLSESVAALTRGSLPAGISIRDLGDHRLKDLGAPERLYQLCAPGLDAEFPSLRSLDNPNLLHNLPAQPASFIGRRKELSEVGDLIGKSRLVTLTGAGGAGKTRLALQVAVELLDGSGDGVWLVELAPLSEPELVPATICEALGVRVQPGRTALDSLTDALTARRILVVLDNCEHLTGACAKTADVLLRRCPEVYLLATSQEPLGVSGETIYRVPSMSLPAAAAEGADSDAVALFLERSRTQGMEVPLDEVTMGLVVSICRRLDGMPLAIELAAARARSMSLADLLRRLDQRFRLLTGGSRSALERQQTLRATVDWSYRLLNEVEQALLRRLAIFVDTFDLAAAEKVCGFGDIDIFDIGTLIGSLVDKSLVVTEAAGGALRYRLLETIRQYAAERLAETADEEPAILGHAYVEHYLALVERASEQFVGGDEFEGIAALDTEAPNLRRAVIRAAAEPDLATVALRFAVDLNRYWVTRDPDNEMIAAYHGMFERGVHGQDALLGRAMAVVGLHGRAGNPRSLALAEQAVELVRPTGDPVALVEALAARAVLDYFAGRAAEGLAAGEEAYAVAQSLGQDRLVIMSIVGLVLCLHHTEDTARIRHLYDEGIACAQRTGQLGVSRVLLNNAGVAALREGDLVRARSHLERALEGSARLRYESHHALVNLGWVARVEGDDQTARSLFDDSIRVSRRNGDRSGLAYSCLALACSAGDGGDWEEAAALHGLAQAFIELSDDPWQTPESEYREQSLDLARAALGDRFDRLYTETYGLRFEEALKRTPAPRAPL
jgi:predicted ATPase